MLERLSGLVARRRRVVLVAAMLLALVGASASATLFARLTAGGFDDPRAESGRAAEAFQDGHLAWLLGDFTVTGTIIATVRVMLFAVAFGLAVDYQVLMLSRIREGYERRGDGTAAVAMGLERIGRIVTAVAVLLDATPVRGALLSAAMRLGGRATWLAPDTSWAGMAARPDRPGRAGSPYVALADRRIPVTPHRRRYASLAAQPAATPVTVATEPPLGRRCLALDPRQSRGHGGHGNGGAT